MQSVYKINKKHDDDGGADSDDNTSSTRACLCSHFGLFSHAMTSEGVFLGSFADRAYLSNVRFSFRDVAGGAEIERALATPTPMRVSEHAILAHVEVAVAFRFSPLMILRSHELLQVRLWCRLLGVADTLGLANKLVFFTVLDKHVLQEPAAIHALGGTRNNGQICVLEEHFPERLFSAFEARPPGTPPSIAIHLPAAWATLIASGRWKTFSLVCDAGTRTNDVFALEWGHLLVLQKPGLNAVPDFEDVELSQSSHQEIADKLREVHASVAGSAPRHKLEELERLIFISQREADALDVELAKTLYMFTGFGDLKGVGVSHRRYRLLFMLKVLLACFGLKSSRRFENTRNTKEESERTTSATRWVMWTTLAAPSLFYPDPCLLSCIRESF